MLLILHRPQDATKPFRFNYASESQLQRGIADVLTRGGFRFIKEFRLVGVGRLDFLLESDVAIEAKIGGSANDLMRQVSRYAASDKVAAILVVTDRATHTLPESFNGKPLLVHSLVEGAF